MKTDLRWSKSDLLFRTYLQSEVHVSPVGLDEEWVLSATAQFELPLDGEKAASASGREAQAPAGRARPRGRSEAGVLLVRERRTTRRPRPPHKPPSWLLSWTKCAAEEERASDGALSRLAPLFSWLAAQERGNGGHLRPRILDVLRDGKAVDFVYIT